MADLDHKDPDCHRNIDRCRMVGLGRMGLDHRRSTGHRHMADLDLTEGVLYQKDFVGLSLCLILVDYSA